MLLGLALLLAVGVPVAMADDLRPDGGFRILGWTAETSTSECIGDPRSALCAAETYKSCVLWGRPELCDIVRNPYPMERVFLPDNYRRLSQTLYQLLDQRPLAGGDIPPPQAKGPHAWKAGDIAMLMQWHTCDPRDQCVIESREDPARKYGEGCPPLYCVGFRSKPGPPNTPETFILRQVGDRWIVVDRTYGVVLPASFWGR